MMDLRVDVVSVLLKDRVPDGDSNDDRNDPIVIASEKSHQRNGGFPSAQPLTDSTDSE